MDRVEGYVDPCLPEIVRLALLIVKEFLGEVPEKVCEVLLKGGPQPLREISIQSGLTKRETCNAIIVLVQHSFASAQLQEEVVGPRKLLTQYVYKANSQRIVQVLRQPRMLMHVSDTMGEWAERVVEILMENGQLTFESLVQRLAGKWDITEAAASAHASRTLVILMRDLYIEQAPPCDLPLTMAPDPRKPKRKPKSKQDEKDQLQSAHELTISQYQKMRFKVPAAVITAQVHAAVAEDDDDGDAMELDVPVPEDDGVVLLRVNFEAFEKCFRHQICVDAVDERHGRSPSLVVKAMLDLSRPREVDPREASSAPVTQSMITEQLNRTAAAARDPDLKPEEPTDTLLLELYEAEMAPVTLSEDGTWRVAMHTIIGMVQFQCISGYLKQRFGQRGLRIWRLLLLEHYLQAEHIEKEVMINTRDVRRHLYAMLKGGYIDIQEIPKSAEHAPSKTVYTYGVMYHKTQTQLLSDLYKAAGNILSRCQFEMEREKEVLELASRKTRGDAIKMSSAQLKAAQRLQGVNEKAR